MHHNSLFSGIVFFVFITFFFDWLSLVVALVFAFIIMGTQQTIWHHRYATHHAYKIKYKWVKIFIRNMVPRFLLEEVYVVSHYVHHALSDEPGDPYNAKGGFWYCMLSEENHQCTARNLSENDYKRVRNLLVHSGIYTNSYEEYQKWGTVTNPLHTIPHMITNWVIWYALLYFIGGHSLATAVIGSNFVYLIALRYFNYDGHGSGKEAWKDGVDYDRTNLSVNQAVYGLVSGEWHNNHHLFPRSANTGFLDHQIDFAYQAIVLMEKAGLVTDVVDAKSEFDTKYLEQQKGNQ